MSKIEQHGLKKLNSKLLKWSISIFTLDKLAFNKNKLVNWSLIFQKLDILIHPSSFFIKHYKGLNCLILKRLGTNLSIYFY